MEARDLTLSSTEIVTNEFSFFVRVEKTQTYTNPFDHPVEFTYRFEDLKTETTICNIRAEILFEGKKKVLFRLSEINFN
jgi:hypothetical protein